MSVLRLGILAVVLSLALLPTAGAQSALDDDTKSAPAQPRFRVVEGDIVKFGPQLVALFGIDAPDKGQTCDDGQWWPSPLARKALEGFIAGRPVTCRQVESDARTNRPVAQCFAGADDLQEKMVSAGWAWAFVRQSDRYVPEERDAAIRKVGVHGHRCLPPWEWRAQQRLSNEKRQGQ